MAISDYSVPLGTIVEEFHFEILFAPDHYQEVPVKDDDVNRPGLQLVGYFDHFSPYKIQMMGRMEATFIEKFSSQRRKEAFEELFSKGIPALILSADVELFSECMKAAKKHDVTILRSDDHTSTTMTSLTAFLRLYLAPRITLHGVLVEIYGEGILLLGDSGVGKSETAIELVKRGHRLIADDAVEIKKVSAITLVGSAPAVIRHFIELRGIGVVDVRQIFGMGAVKLTEKVDLVVNLEEWEESKPYDRLGMESQHTTILDIKVPAITIPVKPGRNLAVIIEVAAMSNRNKKLGFNPAKELTDRMSKEFGMPKMSF